MTVLDCLRAGQNVFAEKKRVRGMSIRYDWLDWLGGYPYEVARVDEIFEFYKSKGYVLQNLKTCSGLGCNEFVFTRYSN
mgnify:CR=1 FL=1